MVKNIIGIALTLLIGTIQSNLIIQSPMSLRKKFPEGIIPASYANFGYIPYGHTMVGRLYFDPKIDTLCEPVPQQDFQFNKTLNNEGFMTPFMLADRGKCSFVTKVRNMEDAGAAVGIVIDNQAEEDIQDVVMADDGTGAGIRMPSMLIGQKDGQVLIDFIKSASKDELNQFSMMVSFDLSRPDNRVEYDIWYSSSSDRVLDFIQDFSKIDKKFGDQVLMSPHFKFWSCLDCDAAFKETHCFGNGKYCTTDSNHDNLSGREIIAEDLRQMCIYKAAYADEDTRQNYWKYMKSVHEQCYGSVNEDCSRLAHKDTGMNYRETEDCVNKSFNDTNWETTDDMVKNEMIDKEMVYYGKYGPATFPGLVINNQTFRGQLEIEAVLNSICAGFYDLPKMCSKYLSTNDINNAELLFMREGRHSYGRVFGICFAVMFIVVIILCCYRRYAKREMKSQMNQQIETAVNQYLALSNKDLEAKDRASTSEELGEIK